MSIDKNMGGTFWRRPTLDGTGRIIRRNIHAVFTVINAPRRTR